MARRAAHPPKAGGGLWLITYSDLMTLLMTFFVLLVSMAVIDERAKREVLGSVSQTFGMGKGILNPATKQLNSARPVEPGRMDQLAVEDMEPLRDIIFDESEKDINFQENRYVQIFSINDEVLFAPGSTELTPRGVALLDKILPYLQRIEYPVLVAGHTAARREEEGENYRVDLDSGVLDSTWPLSYRRAIAVFRHFIDRGISSGRLTLEAFGQHHPRFSNETPEGRKQNRRVDLVLDKRNREWIEKVERAREKNPQAPQDLYYKGFKFDLTMPGENPREGS